MKAKLAFVAGLGAGYVLGTRAGRGSYESIKRSVKSMWHTDAVQETVATVAKTVKDEAADVAEQLGRKVKSAVPHGKPAEEAPSGGDRPATSTTSGPETATPPATADVDSDPALTDQEGQDWAAEGGAGPTGPAT
ncbi:hypothetical protein [Specibacter sp. RAF43]|uniref:hypothetical protein n=1 Tax=Specibacter sp. RAF43 TaxID=3233057 RepID=UPI003F9B2AF8